MKRLFVETRIFRERIDEVGLNLLNEIQKEILEFPEKGDLIPASGGIKKVLKQLVGILKEGK